MPFNRLQKLRGARQLSPVATFTDMPSVRAASWPPQAAPPQAPAAAAAAAADKIVLPTIYEEEDDLEH
jgi:hypothetical protein